MKDPLQGDDWCLAAAAFGCSPCRSAVAVWLPPTRQARETLALALDAWPTAGPWTK